MKGTLGFKMDISAIRYKVNVYLRVVKTVLRKDRILGFYTFSFTYIYVYYFVQEFEYKERILSSIVDLVTLSIFLGVSPSV